MDWNTYLKNQSVAYYNVSDLKITTINALIKIANGNLAIKCFLQSEIGVAKSTRATKKSTLF